MLEAPGGGLALVPFHDLMCTLVYPEKSASIPGAQAERAGALTRSGPFAPDPGRQGGYLFISSSRSRS